MLYVVVYIYDMHSLPDDLRAMTKTIDAEDDDEEEITDTMSFEIAKGWLRGSCLYVPICTAIVCRATTS